MFQLAMFVQSILLIFQPAGSSVLSSPSIPILASLAIIACLSSSPHARHTYNLISSSIFLTFSTTSLTWEAVTPATLFILEGFRFGEGLVCIACPLLHHHPH